MKDKDRDQSKEIARRIARDMLEADHRALEIDPPNWPVVTVRVKGGTRATGSPLYGD